MTIYNLDILLSQFGTSHCSMSGSNCCFLTCIQVSQETDKVVWYSHVFKNFPQFFVIHMVKGFSIVNEAEVDVFLEFSCFFYDPKNIGNLINGSSASAFSKPNLNIWNTWFMYCWSLSWRILNITLLAWGFPHSSVGKEFAWNAGYLGSITGSGRSPGEGNNNLLQ